MTEKRLIYAEDVIEVMANRLYETLTNFLLCTTATESRICFDTCCKVAEHEVDNIPTAYNVDRVIEQLEDYDTCTDRCSNRSYCNSCKDLIIDRGEAIDLVEKGGKE